MAVSEKYAATSAYVSISHANRSPRLPYAATVYNGLRVADFVFTAAPDNYLLFFGRIHPDKGPAEAIEIARRSGKRLFLAGLVQDAAYFRERIEPLLSDTVVFLGLAGPAQRNRLLGHALALLHPRSRKGCCPRQPWVFCRNPRRCPLERAEMLNWRLYETS